jgi:eukaryotic-like serine/threonine-protein kinase
MSLLRQVLMLLAFLYAASQLSSATLTDKDTILLANFANNTGDEIFDGSLEQPLYTALEESPFLSVLTGASVAAALKEMGRPVNAPLDPEITRQACQRTHSKAYIAGSLTRQDTEFLIALQAVDCESGQPLAQVHTAAPSQNRILDTLGDTVSKLRLQLGESSESVREFSTPLSRATSPSFEALKSWSAALKAQQESSNLAEGSQAALPLLENAVKLDPNFASALFTIGLIYRDSLQEARARDYLIRAFKLGERASVREKFRNVGLYYGFVTVEYDKAVETYQKWIKSYPRDERPISNLGSFYGDVCRYEQAIVQFREARRMNPSNVIYHEDLMEILTAVGRFGEAREAYQEMLRMKLDDDSPHVFLYSIAALQHDAREMAQQAAWFEGKPELQHEILSEEADAEAYGGHLARARELTRQAVESGVRADNKEQAAAWQLNSAWREELLGNANEAHEQTIRALEIAPESREGSAVAAILLARTGDISKAEAIAKELEQRYPVHAIVQSYWLPCIRAQISLASKHPQSALQQLERARPYDPLLPQVAFYSPLYSVVLRAEAYLALGQPAAAVKEWSRISQYPGIVQLSATAPISKLQLARALALQERKGSSSARAQARSAYQGFLALWRDADPDIEILKEARAEFAALR